MPALDPPSPRWRLGRLGRRILVAFLLVSLGSLGITALVSYRQSERVLERFLADNVEKTARTFAAELDLFLEQERATLRGLTLPAAPAPGTLAAVVEGDPHLEGLFLLDGAGGWLDGSVPEAEAPEWALAACRQSLTDPVHAMTHAGEGHAHEVVVAVPHAPSGGMLCGRLSFTLHQEMLTERVQSLYSGRAYIVDRGGRVVCHAFEEHEPHTSRGELLAGQASAVAAAGVAWGGAVGGEDGRSLAAFVPANTLPWGVWVEVDAAEAAAPLRDSLRWLLGFVLLFGLGVAGAAALLARRLVRPIEEMARAAREIAADRPGRTVPIRGNDEVAELAQEFNRMSEALAASYAELDARVDLRTRELRSAREFSDLLLDSMQERILVIDRDLNVVRANEAAKRAYGEEILGCRCAAVHRRAAAQGGVCPAQRVFDAGAPLREERVTEREVLAVDSYPVLGPDGQPEAVVEIARDVTDTKRFNARLAHQEKMAAMGTLAAGLTHEIGNPLASMSSELEMLEQAWDPEEARQSLPVLRDQVRRISDLLRELVDFGRPAREAVETLDATAVAGDVVRLLRHDPRSKGVELAVLPGARAEVRTSRDRLVQVLLNLGLNALDAVEGRGRVEVRVRREPTDEVRIEVSDDGPGMPGEVASRVFEPFFTTRPLGEGTGLGLFVSERIVDQLGGRIEVRTAPGRGSTFAVVLPGDRGGAPSEAADA